jgi:adhesin/invasin
MVSCLMISRRFLSLPFGSLAFGLAIPLLTVACQKVPLLAPTGSTIILTASATALPVNGTTDLTAQILEQSGNPPHGGTLITFTTTLGGIEPSEARTDSNGRVIVKFRAGVSNGTATIVASSGGATTGTAGAAKIAIGTAAVARIGVSANPNPVSSNGGVATIVANVLDVNGNALAGVPVNFTTSAGALASSFVNTDQNGIAQTSLTTNAQATVTATVGISSTTPGTGTGGTTGGTTTGQASATVTVNVNPLPTVSITAPSGTLTTGFPIAFTIAASPGTGSTAQIRDVSVDFGDNSRPADLGAVSGTGLTVQHKYDNDNTYTVRVTVLDSLGGTTSAATVIVVLPAPPLGVTITFTKAASTLTTTVTFTATVTPATTTVSSYLWDFGDGQSVTTTSNQAVHPYPNAPASVYTVTVTVFPTTGLPATGKTAVSIP